MKKFADRLEKIQCTLAMIFFIIFIVCIILQILTRYVPFIKVTWTEEISTYCFIWSVLMGAAVELKRNEHFSFDVLRKSLKGKSSLIMEIIINTLLIGFSAFITYCGVMLTKQFWNWSLLSLPAVSQRYTWSALIVSGATMVVYSINNLMEKINAYKGGEQ